MKIPGGIASTVWTPNTLSVPPQFWFAPTGINGGTLVNGADVTSWTDFGPNAYVPAAIGGAGARLTVATGALNGFASANGNGSHHGLLVTPGFTLSTTNSYSVFAVVSWAAGAGQNSYFGFGYSDNFPWGLGIYASSAPANQLWNFLTAAANAKSTFVPSFGTYYGIVIVNNAGTVTGYVNGTSYAMPVTGSPTYPSGPTGFTIGDFSNTVAPFNNFLNGNLVDIAFYQGPLGPTDINGLHTYSINTYALP